MKIKSCLLFFISAMVCLCGHLAVAVDEVPHNISPEQNRQGIGRVTSAEVGTAFVIMTEGRKLYLLTAAHVVGGKQIDIPPCKIDFASPDQSIPCTVTPYVWDEPDIAVIVADAEGIHGSFAKLKLGDSALLPNDGTKIYTLGYPEGGSMRRQDGVISGSVPPSFLIRGIDPQKGQSGSPIISTADGNVVGVILERARDKSEQRVREIDSVKLFLRRQTLFQNLMMLTRPPAGASGPLVASDLGLSLTNMFANEASPRRWYERAKRYARTDQELPKIANGDNWLQNRRNYISTFNEEIGPFGRGWSSSYNYRVDVDKSTICNLYVWNSRGVRIAMQPPHDCKDVKHTLSAYVTDPKLLDLSLREMLASSELAEHVLPNNLSYTGADYEVARAKYISGGIEITIGTAKYIFNANGKLRQIKSSGRIMELEYDAKDRLNLVRNEEHTQEFAYTPSGRVITIRFNDGSQYDYKYDQRDNLIDVSDSGKSLISYAYDEANRLSRIVDATDKNKETLITYSQNGYRTSVKRGDKEYQWMFHDDTNDMPSVKQRIITSGEVADERRYEFDYHVRRLSMTSMGKKTNYILSECLCLPLEAKTEDHTSVYKYDAFGRLEGATLPYSEVRQSYDNRFNKLNKIEKKINNKWVVEAEAKYDDFGNLIQASTPTTSSVQLSYDKQNRIKSITTGNPERSLTLEYNQIGKPILVTAKGLGQIRVSYKQDSEIDKVSSDEGPSVAQQVASMFNNLLENIQPFTAPIDIDTRFALITSEPYGCDECGRHQE